jgi:hypothetical protein
MAITVTQQRRIIVGRRAYHDNMRRPDDMNAIDERWCECANDGDEARPRRHRVATLAAAGTRRP